MIALLALINVLADIGLSSIARPLFVISGVGLAAFYIRRSPWDYITLNLWFWTFAPFARRLIDLHAGFDRTSYLLGTPTLITLFMLKDILTTGNLFRQPEAKIGLLIVAPVIYGLDIGLVEGDGFSAIIASADWISPVLYYFYFIAHYIRIKEAQPAFRKFFSANALVVVAYCIYQYVDPPLWDLAWMRDSETTFGHPAPFEIRIFGTFNSPGVLATWLGVLILLIPHFLTRLSAFLLPFLVILLLFTLSRSVLGGIVVGFSVAGMLGHKKSLRLVAVVVAVVTIILCMGFVMSPDTVEQLTARVSSVQDLDTDFSALQRAQLYRDAPELLSRYPLGLGIGALGRGAVINQTADLISIDSGPISIYIALGWFAGSVYLVGILLVVVQAVLTARRIRSGASIVLAATAVSLISYLPFFNLGGLSAVTLWFCGGYVAALGAAARISPRATIVTSSRKGRPEKKLVASPQLETHRPR